jgi:hypothetical protein
MIFHQYIIFVVTIRWFPIQIEAAPDYPAYAYPEIARFMFLRLYQGANQNFHPIKISYPDFSLPQSPAGAQGNVDRSRTPHLLPLQQPLRL